MQCNICKELLDNRDIIDDRALSCWKCGYKRELTSEEKQTYRPSKRDADMDYPYYHYFYEG